MTTLFTFNREKLSELFHCVIFTLLIILVSGCGDRHHSHSESETGSIVFSVEWMDAPTTQLSTTVMQAMSCEAAGVDTVTFEVYDENHYYLVGDSWPCSYHQGTVNGVLAGSDRKLVVLGEDSNGDVLYQGEQSGITVTAGQTSDVGEVPMYYIGDDMTLPNVVSTSPADYETWVDVWDPIYVDFSEDIDPATINDNTYYVEYYDGYGYERVYGTFDINGYMADFYPDSNLYYDTTYYVTITTGVTDLAGNHMQSDYEWQFTTEP